jgi:predicted ATPase/DNA-binding winged helix-turn-helix (wHTH) protein
MREFPPFRLDTANQCLWRGDGAAEERISLAPKAFDVLRYLVERPGRLVAHDELLEALWPKTYVQPEVLKSHIASIRAVLGDDARKPQFIETMSRRGYRFIAPVTEGALASHAAARENSTTAATPANPPPSRTTNLPEAVSELIGREAELGEVTALVTEHRLVSLVGAGGIGKTRLALEVARGGLQRFPDGVFVAELGPLSSPELVPATVASALGLTHIVGAVSHEGVAGAVGTKKLLLVIDNCEHVIEAAAGMAEALLRASPGASLVATSREPLRVSGEYVYRVPPLDVPAEDGQDMEDVFRYGAVRLFVSRAHAADPRYVAEGRVAAATAAICRRLDGIPLAIELAATRTVAFGVSGVAARLDDRFRLLTGGSRTALPRQQTMRATLDWSYELLSESERVVLRRLGVFVGAFTLDAASAVAASVDIPASEVTDAVAGLVGKSLLSTDVGGASLHYRLLETTRAYARVKLIEGAEFDRVARHHAAYFRNLLEHAEAELETRPTAEWLGAYVRHTDNMRAALDWAFSSSGDAAVGVALTAAAVPLWFQQSLTVECRGWVERALASLEPGSARGDRREMQLFAALGASLMETKGPAPDTTTAWTKALEIAERLNDIEYQLRALWGLWHFRASRGESRAAMVQAERFFDRVTSTANPTEILVGRRMIGVTLHYLGDQTEARRHLEYMLAHYVAPAHRSHAVRFHYDQRVATRMVLARVLWLQGFSDQALRIALDNVENARAIDHAISLCYALETASLVALWAGDWSVAEHSVAMLLEHSARHALTFWHARGHGLNGVLLIEHGDVGRGVGLLRTNLDELSESGFVPHYRALLGTLAEGLAGVGQVSQGLTVVDEALALSERGEELWCIAELSRIKGEIVLQTGAPKAAATAERLFRQSIDVARRQGALSWELRAAMSLARLWRGQRRVSQARKLLEPVYHRFTEGFGTVDLAAAKVLLTSMR